ncbi:MFS transporter [Gordonia sp. PKS22-38]|uniref:MFS transporter n=1 Tax=Gordonia prachuapensis TaxID=3115651 RepID=A0ABU7MSN9_9ACTN|nr:MFS transporter [Gordonia sp. PKS22-38]
MTTTQLSETTRGRSRLPGIVYVLAAGVFLMGTTEFVVAGILPEIATDLDITVADAGLMVTVFAVGMIVGTPLMAVATLRLRRRVTLALALVVFAIGHVIVAVSSSFPVILGARFLTALSTGGFWAVAAVVAARAACAGASSRALGIVLGGGMLANVIGVPLGAFAGQTIGWRGPFWALTFLALVGAVVIYRLTPDDSSDDPAPSIRRELTSLRDVRVWLVLAGCVAVCGSSLAVYTFIAPLLTDNTGLSSAVVPLVLMVYGAGALIGSNLGGRLGARRPYGVLFAAAIMTFLVLVLLGLLSHHAIVTVALIGFLGLFGMSTNPVLIGKAVRYADQAPTLASALCTSAFNVGTALGSWMAAGALDSAWGPTGPVVVGAAVAAFYLIPLVLLLMRDRADSRASTVR